eukprot:scaffold4897_cov129-Cylindrotheca_fusiformis.AAC.5
MGGARHMVRTSSLKYLLQHPGRRSQRVRACHIVCHMSPGTCRGAHLLVSIGAWQLLKAALQRDNAKDRSLKSCIKHPHIKKQHSIA